MPASIKGLIDLFDRLTRKVSTQTRVNIFILSVIGATLLTMDYVTSYAYKSFVIKDIKEDLHSFVLPLQDSFSPNTPVPKDSSSLKARVLELNTHLPDSHRQLLNAVDLTLFDKKPKIDDESAVSIAKLGEERWLKMQVVDDYIDAEVDAIFNTLMLISAATFILLTFIVLFSMSRLFRPLRALRQLCYDLQEHRCNQLFKGGSYEILQLADAIVSMYRKNQELYRNSVELFKEAAHELKSPIAIMQARVSLYEDAQDTTKEHFIKEIGEDIDHVKQKLKELLLLKEIEWDVEHEPCQYISLKEACETIQNKFRPMLLLRELHIDSIMDENFQIFTHPAAIEKVLLSIFENLFAHAKEQSTIYVRMHHAHKTLTIVSENRETENELYFSSKIGTRIISRFTKALNYDYRIKRVKNFYITKITFRDD